MSPEEDGGRSGSRIARVGAGGDLGGATAGNLFKRAWWAIALRGVLAIVLGIVILSRPGVTLALFIALLGIYLFFDGLFTLVAAFQSAQKGRSWWPYVLEGLVSVAVGLLAFARPASAALFLIILIAVRAILVGVVEIGTGISVRRATGSSTWLLWLGGLASVAFGLFLLGSPALGLFAMVWVAGIYAITFGISLDGEAFRLRGFERRRLVTR